MADDNKGPSAEEINAAKNAQDELTASMKEYREELEKAKNQQELLAKIEKSRLEEQKNIVAKAKATNDLLLKNNEILNSRSAKRNEEKEIQADLYKKALEMFKEEKKALKTVTEERAKKLQEHIEKLEEKEELGKDEQKRLARLKHRLDSNQQTYEDHLIALKQGLDYQRDIAEATVNYANATEKAESFTQSWANQLTGVTASSFNNSIFASIGHLGGLSAALSDMGSTLGNVFTGTNIATGLLQKIGESTMFMVTATDSANASFYKATGAAEEYEATISTVRTEAASFGVNIEEAGAAVTELFQSMSQFSQLTQEAQVEVAAFSATMSELGVDNQVTAQTFDVLTRGLGKTTGEAMQMSAEITKSAQAIGMSVGQMHQAFNDALPTLAVYGDKAISVFQGLASAAKETGLETSRLLDIASQFDTFDSAAESVGRLNGILGGNYLNSLEMVNMTEDERIRKMIEATQASGKAFNQLGRFEQKAIASAAGITDMAEANKLFGMSLEAYDDMTDKSKAGAMSQEEMAEQADKARTAQEKLTNLFQSLAIAVQPIINLFHGFMDIILGIQNIMGPFFAPVLAAVAAGFLYMKIQTMQATAALAMHARAQQLELLIGSMQEGQQKAARVAELARIQTKLGLTTATGAETTATGLNTVATGANTGSKEVNAAVEGAATGVKKLSIAETIKDTAAKALNTIGIGTNTTAEKTGTLAKLGAVAAGAAKLAGTIALTIAEKALTAAVYTGAAAWVFLKAIWGGFVAIATAVGTALGFTAQGAAGTAAAATPAAAGIGAISAAAAAGATGLLVLSLLAVSLGAGFALVGYGISLAAEGIVKMAEGGLVAVAVLGGLALLMLALAKGAALLGGVAPIAMAGMLLLAAGFMAIAFALMFISTEDLEAVSTIFKGFETLASAAAGIVMVNWALLGLLTTLEDMGEDADDFADTINSISASMWNLSFAMMFMDMAKFDKIGTLFKSLAKISANNSALTQTAGAITAIGNAINNIPAFGAMSLSFLLEDLKDFGEVGANVTAPMKATAQFVQTTTQVEDKHVKNATKLIDQVVRYADVVEGGGFAAAASNFLNELVKVLGGGKDEKKEDKGNDIYLVLDGPGQKVIASAVGAQLNKKNNLYVKNS